MIPTPSGYKSRRSCQSIFEGFGVDETQAAVAPNATAISMNDRLVIMAISTAFIETNCFVQVENVTAPGNVNPPFSF
jgi:hypothetical protein